MIIIGLPWGRQEGFSPFQILLLTPFNALHIPQHREPCSTPANTPTPLAQPAAPSPFISPNDLVLLPVLYIWPCSIPHTILTSHLFTSPRRSLLTLPLSAGNPHLSSFPHSLTWQCQSSPRTASLIANSLRKAWGLCQFLLSSQDSLSHTHSYLLLVTTPSRRTMLGWLNCPIIVASRRKFHHCESE